MEINRKPVKIIGKPLNISGKSMKINSKLMEILRNPAKLNRKLMKIIGKHLMSLEHIGNRWNSLKIVGLRWTPLIIMENHGDALENLWESWETSASMWGRILGLVAIVENVGNGGNHCNSSGNGGGRCKSLETARKLWESMERVGTETMENIESLWKALETWCPVPN